MPSVYDTRIWIAYLVSIGLIHKRTSASHFIYDYPEGHTGGSLSRPIIVEQNWDQIPVDHIARSLRVLGKTMKDFRAYVNSQKKSK
jgi:hypothetical protein